LCTHPEREKIEAEIVSGTSFRTISQRYGVSPSAISRHASSHIPKAVSLAARAATLEHHGKRVIDRIRELNARALELLDAASSEGAFSAAAAIIRELRELLALEAKLLGELDEGRVSVNVDARTLAVHIARALEPYPEAAAAASSAIMEVVGGSGN